MLIPPLNEAVRALPNNSQDTEEKGDPRLGREGVTRLLSLCGPLQGTFSLENRPSSWTLRGLALELWTRLLASLGLRPDVCSLSCSRPAFAPGLPSCSFLCMKRASPRPFRGCSFFSWKPHLTVTASRGSSCPPSNAHPIPCPSLPCPYLPVLLSL